MLGGRVNRANSQLLNLVKVITVHDPRDIVRGVRGNQDNGNYQNSEQSQDNSHAANHNS